MNARQCSFERHALTEPSVTRTDVSGGPFSLESSNLDFPVKPQLKTSRRPLIWRQARFLRALSEKQNTNCFPIKLVELTSCNLWSSCRSSSSSSRSSSWLSPPLPDSGNT